MLWFDWRRESSAGSPALLPRIEEANDCAARLLGAQSAAELRGLPLSSLFAQDSWPLIEAELAHLGELPPRTLAIELRAGAEKGARARIVALGDPRGAGTPALLQLQAGADAKVEALERPPVATLVCRRLAHGLLHDLRSPMMAISGFADVLGFRHSAELGADARRCVESIVAATRRLEGMIEQLSSQTRLAAGELELRPLDLRELLRNLAGETRAAAPELELVAELPLVAGDALLLREAFAALLEEARGEPAAAGEPRLRIELVHARGRARVSILGPGLPSGSVELELARRALELHGGRLRIEPRADAQPRFEVELPAPEGR